ncbi:MAG: 2-oxoglutarate ferredoxin oxidoreductase subunit alpha, partial [Rhodospirillaceae bacterium]
ASPLLHSLSKMAEYGVTTFQAEDEIAAICAALGASFAGKLGLTTSSGPGIALKTEALGLAISAELPLVVVNAQRGGPSTGLPTKTEQSDLFQAVMGRNGDAPVPVIAACTPADAFESAIEAVRLAVTHMTPVILLLDGYIANASEPWKIPSLDSYAPFPVAFQTDVDSFAPFKRNPDSLARQWALPGTPGLEHRVGGLEKDYDKGTVSYDGSNHEKMTRMRSGKLEAIARSLPPQGVELGAETGKVALLGWGSTYGALHRATRELIDAGHAVSHIHLRNMAPFPTNLKELLAGFDQIIVPEMNAGQLALLLRAHLLRDVHSLSKVTGQPFRIAEITDAVHARLEA